MAIGLIPKKLDNTAPQTDADSSSQVMAAPDRASPRNPSPLTLREASPWGGGGLIHLVGRSLIPRKRIKVELDLGCLVILPKVTDENNHINFPGQESTQGWG